VTVDTPETVAEAARAGPRAPAWPEIRIEFMTVRGGVRLIV
jgi:hypothetical protein